MKPHSNAWCDAPPKLSLVPGEVHVWRFDLEVSDADVERHLCLLSLDEQARANRFVFKKHRDRYIVARGALRRTLGRYLQTDPAALRFSYASHGKPSLSSECNPLDLRFNLSHSEGVALLALAISCEVGIDVEQVRADFPYQEIARQCFSAAEYGLLRATEPEFRRAIFFKYWTHKEAFIKATGVGLTYPLNRFEVSLVAGVPIQFLNTAEQVPNHALHDLSPCAGYVGAIAVLGTCTAILLWAD